MRDPHDGYRRRSSAISRRSQLHQRVPQRRCCSCAGTGAAGTVTLARRRRPGPRRDGRGVRRSSLAASRRAEASRRAPAIGRREVRRRARAEGTVVVTTCRQPETLGTLPRVDRWLPTTAPLDVVVVENRPGSPATARLLAERFEDRRPHPLRRGATTRACRAHATPGCSGRRAELVAFIDDDVVVDRGWIERRPPGSTRAPDVACVTGMILPLRLDTPEQVLLEQFATFGKGFAYARVHAEETRAARSSFPLHRGTGGFGREHRSCGPLGARAAGLRLRAGGRHADTGRRGHGLLHPGAASGRGDRLRARALVWHEHPDGWEHLRRDAFHYGIGLTAMLAKQRCAARTARLVRPPGGVRSPHLEPRSRKNKSKRAATPARLDSLERAGMLVGPAAYVASSFFTTRTVRSLHRQRA